MRIRVTHLASSVTLELIREKFVPYGTVQSVTLLQGGDQDEAVAYVEMPSPEDGAAAIRTLNGSELCGRVVQISPASSIPSDPHETS